MAVITIGGNLGAGKTTLAGKLAPALGYEEIYIGGIFREIAAERGMSIEQFYEELKNDPALERSVDERQATLMRERDNLVIQGRVAWFFASHYLESGPAAIREEFSSERRDVPTTDMSISRGGNLASEPKITPKAADSAIKSTFKIVAQQSPFKVINLFLAVDSLIGAQRVAERKENAGKPISEVARVTTLRAQHERERYASLYGIEDYFDPTHYDITLDTSSLTEKAVFQNIMDQLHRFGIIA